jgi:hypothetical protein
MFEIIDATGTTVKTAISRSEALRVQTVLETCTLQAHRVRAAASVFASVEWIDDIPVRTV